MAPVAHLLLSWLSTIELVENRRERVLITLSGIAPDIDGAGVIIDKITGTTNYYFEYHHVVGHNVFAGIFLSVLVYLLSVKQRSLAAILAFGVVQLHVLCDLIGSKGPDGYNWPICYLYPISETLKLSWSGQWQLNAWQNLVIAALAFSACIFYVHTRAITVFELCGQKLDAAAVGLYKRLLANTA